jgi:hypothetical protein
MADLTGIENAGEFFSAHYLQERLPDELKGFDAATQAVLDQRVSALRSTGTHLFRALADLGGSTASGRAEVAHDLVVRALEALGYVRAHGYAALERADSANQAVPLLAELTQGALPYVYVLEAGIPQEEQTLLEQTVVSVSRLPDETSDSGLSIPAALTLDEAVGLLFAKETPPRWILVLGGREVILAERGRWGRGQFLRFELETLLRRRDPVALRTAAALLSRELLAPGAGRPIPEALIESSHQHAVGVSGDLKFAAREAVELLGNEAVYYTRTSLKKAMYGDRAARELTEDCLVYLFRLLFLFYAEARAGELQGLPMGAEEYARGYSLEVLRELEQVPLTTPEARDGFFFHDSLQKLFQLVNDGFEPIQTHLVRQQDRAADFLDRGFTLKGLHSTLFSPQSTPRLSRAKLRNETLQQVIRLLSLSPEGRRKSGKAWGRGRISYAQLGIGELGAVYEGLLSYSGFFAKETLYEVHKAGADTTDATQQSFFVPERELAKYRDEELAFSDREGKPARRRHTQGTFIFRLAGRDREQSASYYTPQVLTRCLVKYALKELLPGKSADDILRLSICEPAMGSGAFLVEAIDQLADAYLERKQAERNERIAAADYTLEKQRVKACLAEERCYGVDLNPMATRLAGVSLWLGTMHQGQPAPSYAARLFVGNSLIGARFAMFLPEDFASDELLAKAILLLLKKTAPEALEEELGKMLQAWAKLAPDGVAEVRAGLEDVLVAEESEGEVDEAADDTSAMDDAARAKARDQVIQKFLKKQAAKLKVPRWQRRPPRPLTIEQIVSGQRPHRAIYHFFLPHPDMSAFEGEKVLKELAPEAIEALKAWRKDILVTPSEPELRRLDELSAIVDERLRRLVDDRRHVLDGSRSDLHVWGQDRPIPPLGGWLSVGERERLVASSRAEQSAYGQLRRLMDLWACLWAWPLTDVTLLPNRKTWLAAAESVLGVEPSNIAGRVQLGLVLPLEAEDDTPESDAKAAGLWDAVRGSRTYLRPLPWELEAPEVFLDGGFDLIVGNPPWLRLDWNEQRILEEQEPRLALDGVSSSDVAKSRRSVLSNATRTLEYVRTACELQGSQAYLGSASNYPLLQGLRTNLYKCFLIQSWQIGSPGGVAALIHQDSIFDDPKGGRLRAAAYERVRWVFRFKNELKLFLDVDHHTAYVLSVCGEVRPAQHMSMICNLYHPSTIDDSFAHDGAGAVPGIKTDAGDFERRGHRSRMVLVTHPELSIFAILFDSVGASPGRARLPLVHSTEALAVLQKIAAHRRRLRDLDAGVYGTIMWNETDAQKDGIIRRETCVPSAPDFWILSGPHFSIATPFNKSPRAGCRHNSDYDVVDLVSIPDDYLPRTNFVPNDVSMYTERTPAFHGAPTTLFFRQVHRKMLALTGERTLIAAIIPPGVGHVVAAVSLTFSEISELVATHSLWCSIVLDYLVRAKGGSDLTANPVSRHSPSPRPDRSSASPELPYEPLCRPVAGALEPIRHFRLDPG